MLWYCAYSRGLQTLAQGRMCLAGNLHLPYGQSLVSCKFPIHLTNLNFVLSVTLVLTVILVLLALVVQPVVMSPVTHLSQDVQEFQYPEQSC